MFFPFRSIPGHLFLPKFLEGDSYRDQEKLGIFKNYSYDLLLFGNFQNRG